ncbi:hypothetical protein OPV22_013321 [Ensete ventricosum]|uniref:Uncharacterized protein n=1 Tax=Ensete ventricosum TaxID=4639 RepID=A0AAV8R560_ENSVE|nr:hypothetical protein OPV22_013321 [Ensete ventricosum]
MSWQSVVCCCCECDTLAYLEQQFRKLSLWNSYPSMSRMVTSASIGRGGAVNLSKISICYTHVLGWQYGHPTIKKSICSQLVKDEAPEDLSV